MKLLFILLSIVLFSGCVKKSEYIKTPEVNKKSEYIDILKLECYNHNVNSCYKAGQFYLDKNESNNALYYFDQGCANFYNAGFIMTKLGYKSDQNSCLEEAKILKTKHKLSSIEVLSAAIKLKKVAEYYYKKNDFKQAKEYYMASLTWKTDGEVYYILSQMALKGEGAVKDYMLSKKYYSLYIWAGLKMSNINARLLDKLMYNRLNILSLSVEFKMTLLANGTVSDVSLTKPSKDDLINKIILDDIKKRIYHPIPDEYGIEEMPFITAYLIEHK